MTARHDSAEIGWLRLPGCTLPEVFARVPGI
jgi:hypothetical protein